MTDITSHLVETVQKKPLMQVPLKTGQIPGSDATMRAAAVKFEATFLTEMLKYSGLGKMPEGFNGGAGEAGFSDFLVREYATAIAETRSTGLADQVYRALKERSQA